MFPNQPSAACPGLGSAHGEAGLEQRVLLLYRYNFKKHFFKFHMHAGDPGLIPGSGRSPREGNGN